jgi:exopolyphosphatase/pppGpp-phosphohydrolase
MKEFYIDLGSSTIKVYEYGSALKLLEDYSIYFKNSFSEETGISPENKAELYDYFHAIKDNYHLMYENTHIYVTGIFRLLTPPLKQELVKYFHKQLDLHFNIISHGIENYYLGMAMRNDYNNKKVMVINMGGKTTEIVTFKENNILGRKNINIGVAELLNAFPGVNDQYSSINLEDMVNFVKEKISGIDFDTNYDCAIFTGGEERFEKLTGYNLIENTIFNDGIHRFMINFDDFEKGNKNILYKISLQELYNLMPGNPKWMDGARPGAVLPQAIFEKANIKIIIPSDLNLINGVINDI